ncbi:hypothetical protein [Streptomyces sp. NPDC020607]|uniref:hypothetical protein n=1 Tax=Streptomyces sp. NPDC020607 TaxID=3365082 RepID=UPI00379902E6
MTIDSAPALDWASLGRDFASAHTEFEANDLLHAASADEPTGMEIVDADEPDGADSERAVWLTPVTDIRSYFHHEASDYTPYVADTLFDVQRAARIDEELVLVGAEQKIGGYRIDILAKTRVAGVDRFVVIENQLGKSDADHLGRLISCAAEVNASHAIWICTEFRSEHLKVMDALRRDGAGCTYIPLIIDGARSGGESLASFDLAVPPTYPTPEDPMRERLHALVRQAQAAELALVRVWSIVRSNPGVDFTRYRSLLSDLEYRSEGNSKKASGLLEIIPTRRRTNGDS